MLTTEDIQARLHEEAARRNLSILHAIESGSRAWGLASTDSDFDVRFVYHHPKSRYLEVQRPQDTLGPILEGLLDFAGWDLPKFLEHLAKSNANILEWLHSPLVYDSEPEFLAQARDLAARYFRPGRTIRHYLGIARGAKEAGLGEGGTWNLKKFFYYARPILAADFVDREQRMTPVPFADLCAAHDDLGLRRDLLEWVEYKSTVGEGHRVELPSAVVDPLESLSLRLAEKADREPPTQIDWEPANEFLRATLDGLS